MKEVNVVRDERTRKEGNGLGNPLMSVKNE